MTKKKVTKKRAAKKPAHPSFVFVGDPRDDHNPTQNCFRGMTFKLNGPAVEVRDPEAAAKLAANSHFKAK
jgi:hypothetical protein